MKKIITTFILILFSLVLVSCSDKKHTNDEIQILFYTGRNASKVDTYKNLTANTVIVEPEEPTRPGFRFDGWFVDKELTIEWDFNNPIGNKSFVLYARWGTGFFSIDYRVNGGNMPAGFKYLEDYPEEERDPETNEELLQYLFYTVGKNSVLPRPTRVGYTFKNWFLYDEYMWEGAPENTPLPTKPGDRGHNTVPSSLSKDLVLFAHWDPIKMSVAFRPNYPVEGVITNSNYKSRTLTYGLDFIYDSNYVDQANVNRLYDFVGLDLAYEFLGWNDQIDGTGNWYGDGTGTHGNNESTSLAVTNLRNLYGQWKLKNA